MCNLRAAYFAAVADRYNVCVKSSLRKFPFLRNLCDLARSAFFASLRRVATTEDAREILLGQIGMRVGFPAREHFADLLSRPPPYADLAGPAPQTEPSLRSDIVFITGRFRSGSTLLWNIFRHVPQTTAYYEPFNERRWFDPATRGAHTDATHLHVSDYWAEYEGLEDLGSLFDERWKFEHLYMTEDAWNAPMQAYVKALIEHSKGRPVLQFNEVDFRLPWLRGRFPHASIIHIYRHPRDQWYSTLGKFNGDMRSLTIKGFVEIDSFYLLRYARDLRHHFPFLTLENDAHPYELFYQIWKLSFLFGCCYSDMSLSFEELVHSPAVVIDRLLEKLTMCAQNRHELVSFVSQRPLVNRKRPDNDGWLAHIERRVDADLRNFFNTSRQVAGGRDDDPI